eukprot:6192473-Pleurochrysis_carterae.AAC.5
MKRPCMGYARRRSVWAKRLCSACGGAQGQRETDGAFNHWCVAESSAPFAFLSGSALLGTAQCSEALRGISQLWGSGGMPCSFLTIKEAAASFLV